MFACATLRETGSVVIEVEDDGVRSNTRDLCPAEAKGEYETFSPHSSYLEHHDLNLSIPGTKDTRHGRRRTLAELTGG